MNRFGRVFSVSLFGESHGEAIGVVIDGVKPGLPLTVEDFTEDILRRKSGAKGTTPRIEADVPHILSGVFDGHTTGSPLTVIFNNTSTQSSDYKIFEDVPRPGHADYTGRVKADGFNDPRGGGHFSGRLTLPIVAAGVVAKKMLGYKVEAKLVELGGESDVEKWKDLIDSVVKVHDSVGGVVECRIDCAKVGLGEPFFDSVESLISHAMFAIPGVRGVEFGDGFAAARMKGSEHNDPFTSICGESDLDGIEALRPQKNGAGGINGGITNGNSICFRVAFKPTSSIAQQQQTYNISVKDVVSLQVPGRHDACFALRTPVVVEAMAAITMADLSLIGEK